MFDLNKLCDIVKSSNINLTENDVLNFLKNKKRWPLSYPWGQPSVEVIDTDSSTHQEFFSNDSFIDYDECKKYYDLGYTIIISNILDLNNDLRLLNKKLYDETGLAINGNFYFSKPGQVASFKKHNHVYDVIVKQIYGESEWLLNDKPIKLKDGNVCLVPKNTYHQVINKTSNKLSLTLNIH